MKKVVFINLEKQEDHLDTVYSGEELRDLLENDEISDKEEGFMRGYEDS